MDRDVRLWNIPVKILVSCKCYKRTLNQQDIDHFNGEFSSSGANKAVLYSSSGFNELAIKKARKLDISCMSLFQYEQAGIPDSLAFFDSYLCCPAFYIELDGTEGGLALWDDVLDEAADGFSDESLAQRMARTARDDHKLALDRYTRSSRRLEDWCNRCTWQSERNPSHRMRFSFGVRWVFYKATLEGHLVSGSYSFTDEQFVVSVSTPAIDTLGGEPGPGWERVAERPHRSGNQIVLMMDLPDIESLLHGLRGRPLQTV